MGSTKPYLGRALLACLFLFGPHLACQPTDDEDDGVVDAEPPCEEGLEEVCFVEGADGCLGVRACIDGAFTACEAPPEDVCDGQDDDCDGTVDETFANLGEPCEAGLGQCLDQGAIVCTADGAGTMCDAIAGDPAAETCNALDDDCDGALDEEVEVGVECNTGLPGECAAGETTCEAGDTACVGLTGPVDEICDGLDNDCDGNTDEGPLGGPLSEACYEGAAGTEGVGACVGGARLCIDGGFGACEGQVLPGEDICDGLDNDCNGAADDGAACVCVPGETQPCYGGPDGTEGVGVCSGGTQTCLPDASGFGPCEGAVLPGVELCDGEDDDCNGVVDDAFGVGEPCSDGVGACAVDGARVCDLATGQVVCDAVAAGADAEVCNGIDDDCNGAVDDVAGAGEVCETGVGACATGGIQRCVGDALVCDAVAGEPGVEQCNGRDDDCNGFVDDLPGRGDFCEVGVGVCRSWGNLLCTPEGLRCSAVPNPPLYDYDVCGNNRDDDCSGEVDGPDCLTPCIDGLGSNVDEVCAPTEGCFEDVCTPPVCDGEPALIDGPGRYQGDSSDGPRVDAPSCGLSTDGPEFYYSLALGLDTTVCLDTFGTAFDTVLSVRATCETLRDDIACNDDTGDLQSQVEIEVTAGEILLVAVDGYGAEDGGPFTLNVALGPCGGCASDADCPGRCVEGVCVPPECLEDADCDAGEACDVGQCVPVVCGDGQRMGDETCDDGNADAGDGCAADCTVEGGFVCDDPGDVEPDVCARQGCAVDADCPGEAVCRFGDCLGIGTCPADDRYEDNEVAPTVLEPGRFTDLAVCDEDIYITPICPGGELTVDIYFTHDEGNGDLDMVFFPEGDASVSETDDEQLVYINDEPEPVTQAWRVFGSGGVSNGYVMDVRVEGCGVECDGLPELDRLVPIIGDTTGGPQRETASCADDIISGPEARYVLVGDRRGTVCIDTIGSEIDTLLSLRSDCADPASEIACSDNIEGGFASNVEVEMQPGARYVLVVDSARTHEAGPFVVNFRDGPCAVCQNDDDCASGVCQNGDCAEPVCGDGFRAAGEECDDGGTDDGDGCAADCTVEPGFVCDLPSRIIDDQVIMRGFTHCGPPGDSRRATATNGLPRGSYRVFYEDGAIDNGAGAWLVAAALQISGLEIDRFPQLRNNNRGAVIAAAAGTRTDVVPVSEGHRFLFYYPDGSCGDNGGAITFRVRSVDTCRPAPCAADAACADGEVCDAGECRPVVCGDGLRDVGEECDDDNTEDGDGCSAGCVIEPEAVCRAATDEVFELAIDTRTDCALPGDPRRAVYTPPLPAGTYVVAYGAGSAIDDRSRRFTVGGTIVVEGRQADSLFIDDRFTAFEAEAAAADLRSDLIAVGEGERLGMYYGDINCANNAGTLTFTVRAVDVCGAPPPVDGIPCDVDGDCADGGLCREGVCRAIGACPADDDLEPNELPDAPGRVEPGIYEGLASCDGSDDFYQVRICAGGTLTVDLWFESDDGTFLLDVFPPMGGPPQGDDAQLVYVNEGEFETDFTFWINEITAAEAGYAMRVAIDCGDEEPIDEPLCPDGTPLPECPEGFSPISDYVCEQARGRAAEGGLQVLTVCPALEQPNYGIDGAILPGGAVIGGGFFGDGADGSRLNTAGVWACDAFGEVGFEPFNSDLGLTWSLQVPAPAEYVMGVSIDNFGNVRLDGERVYSNVEPDTFLRGWYLLPVQLDPGTHVFDVRGFNGGGPGAMAFEVYGPFPAGSTADDATMAALDYANNVVFSSGDRVGDTFDSGYECGLGELLITQVTGDPLCVVTETAERCVPVLCPDGSVQVGECPVEPIICPDGSEAPACPDGFVADGTDCVAEQRLAAQVNGFVYDVCRAPFDPVYGADGVIMPRGTQASGGFFGEGAADSRIAATGVYFCRLGTDEVADFGTPGRMGLSIPFEVEVDGFYVTGVGGGFEVEAKIDGNRVGFQVGQEGVWRLGQLYLTAGQHVFEVEISNVGTGQVGAEIYGPFEVAEIISDEALLAAEFADRIIASTIDRVGTQWDYGENSGYFCDDGFRYDGTTDPPTCFRSERFDNCPDVPRCPEGFPVPDCPEGYTEVDGGQSCVRIEAALERDIVYGICDGPNNADLIERGAKLPGGAYLRDDFFGPGPNNPLNESGIWRCAPGTNQARENPIGQQIYTEHCLYIEQTGEYVVGAAADDGYQVLIDGEVVLDDISENERTFREWTLQPVRLEAGAHVINLSGINYGGPGVFGAQIYGPFPDGTTANDVDLQQHDYANSVVFSSSSLIGREFTFGVETGFYCPAELRLDVCLEDAPRCAGPIVGKCAIGRGELCGNGRLELDEACDDGNRVDGDGCTARCETEPGFVCDDVSFGFGVTDAYVNNEADPAWTLSDDGLTIVQNANAEPATYSTSVPLEDGVAVTFDISVQQGGDDDLIGWTVGAGDTPLSAPDQPYLLFSWKQADQNSGGGFGFAPSGLRVGLVDGPITDIELWQFVDQGPLSGVQPAFDLGDEGWADFRIYRVELFRIDNRLIVHVDGQPQFFINNPPAGNLGFYAYSQRSYTATLVSPLGLQVCGPE